MDKIRTCLNTSCTCKQGGVCTPGEHDFGYNDHIKPVELQDPFIAVVDSVLKPFEESIKHITAGEVQRLPCEQEIGFCQQCYLTHHGKPVEATKLQDELDEIQEDTTSMEEKLEAIDAICDCPTKHCKHYESDFDRFVKSNPIKPVEPQEARGGEKSGCEIFYRIIPDSSCYGEPLRIFSTQKEAELYLKDMLARMYNLACLDKDFVTDFRVYPCKIKLQETIDEDFTINDCCPDCTTCHPSEPQEAREECKHKSNKFGAVLVVPGKYWEYQCELCEEYYKIYDKEFITKPLSSEPSQEGATPTIQHKMDCTKLYGNLCSCGADHTHERWCHQLTKEHKSESKCLLPTKCACTCAIPIKSEPVMQTESEWSKEFEKVICNCGTSDLENHGNLCGFRYYGQQNVNIKAFIRTVREEAYNAGLNSNSWLRPNGRDTNVLTKLAEAIKEIEMLKMDVYDIKNVIQGWVNRERLGYNQALDKALAILARITKEE